MFFQFPNSDLLSSSAWSSVIHQPDQDSDPEDLPSTVDIDAIKVNFQRWSVLSTFISPPAI